MKKVNGLIRFETEHVEKTSIPLGIYCTVKEYARQKNLNESTVRKMVSRGNIVSYKFGNQRLIPAGAIPVFKSIRKQKMCQKINLCQKISE